MKKLAKLICCLLLASLVLGTAPAALAEGQYYLRDTDNVHVYTVQSSATRSWEGAVASRAEIERLGFDCFIYEKDGVYRIDSGKFFDQSEAAAYRDALIDAGVCDDAYVTRAYVPQSAADSFSAAIPSGSRPAAPAVPAASYRDGQYVLKDSSNTHVYTVQVAAGRNWDAAVKLRGKMLQAGYDCFIYEIDGVYRIDCGKFLDQKEAAAYRDSIVANTDRSGAYVTRAYVPDDMIWEFENAAALLPCAFPEDQYVLKDSGNTHVYTVQVSAGRNWDAAVKLRGRMLEAGYDSFIYEVDGVYRIDCGKFFDQKEASAYKDSIVANTDRSSAYVTRAYVPDHMICEFEDLYYGC